MTSPIQIYLNTIVIHLQAGNATEHTHRPALQTLLNALLPHHRITNEPRRIACGSPDFEIAKDDVPIGHLEAKDIGTDLDKVQESEQLQRYLPSLNNLLLTDYLEFRWFVEGQFRDDQTVKLANVEQKGKLTALPEEFPRLEKLLQTFVETQVITLRSPEELAKKMAHIAKDLMNDAILRAYQQEEKTGKLHGQLESIHRVLLNTLTPEQFADMLAQTIGYGLFATKCSLVGQPLTRLTANHFVPKTNPFLRSLFDQIAGVELDDRLVWMVDHLVAVLNRTEMASILENFGKRTRQEDPVVHFYETFLAHYDAKLREVRGVYYTPEPVVSYIVRSVDWVLKEKFGLKQGLADNSTLTPSPRGRGESLVHKVQILDPATGTGTFLAAVFAKIYERFRKNQGRWSDYVSKHLLPRVHGFELLMAPYTVAHLKLSLQLQATGYNFQSEEQLRVFLTNTLEEAQQISEQASFTRWLSAEATAANLTKREAPVMVIVGNPPYSGHSFNTGEWINNLLRGLGDKANYFQVDGQPLKERNPKWLNDDYVKFIRFAQWRIEQTGYGVLGFVTNHGYLDNPTFRGMRQALLQAFDEIYILDLHGNSKKKEKAPDGSVDNNVFDIQQGVAIGIFVKYRPSPSLPSPSGRGAGGEGKVYHAHLYGDRALKYQYLLERDLKTTDWTELQPQTPFYLFIPQQTDLLAEYEQGWKMTKIMPIYSVGIVTGQDKETVALDFEGAKTLAQKHSLPETVIKPILYRPFDRNYLVYDETVVTRPRVEVMQHLLTGENLGLLTIRRSRSPNSWKELFVSKYLIAGATSISALDINYCFPLYLYPTDKKGLFTLKAQNTTRKPNFSDEFIQDLETRLNLQLIPEGHGDFQKTISALDVFNYMYAVFHSPTYRQRYAEFLKMDFPRLPLTSDQKLFKQLAELGGQLVNIHLMEADLENESHFPIQGNNLVEKLIYREERVYINQTQYFDHVTPESWEFHIGGYQVCEKWLKDRKGRGLSFEDCSQYLYILAAVEKTRKLMGRIDEEIGEFPIC